NGSYTYSITNNAVQYLNPNNTYDNTITLKSIHVPHKQVSFTIHGVNDAAVIGDPTVPDVTEDSSPTTLAATGSIAVSDVDQNQWSEERGVGGVGGNLGGLRLVANGSYR